MNNIYDAIKEKENQIAIFQAQISGLNTEIEALRVAAPLLLADGEAENDNQPTLLPHAVNATPQPDHSGWQDKPKKRWP